MLYTGVNILLSVIHTGADDSINISEIIIDKIICSCVNDIDIHLMMISDSIIESSAPV